MKHWEQEEKPADLFLQRGRALEEGRHLLINHGDVITDDDIRDYIELSRRRDDELKEEEQGSLDEERERRVQAAQAVARANKRTAQRTAVGLLAALIFAAVAGWEWYQADAAKDEATRQQGIAEQQAKAAEAAKNIAYAKAAEAEAVRIEADKQQEAALRQESRALAALAQSEIRSGDAVNGMLLALRGMPVAAAEKPRPIVSETRRALVDATLARRELSVCAATRVLSWRPVSRRMARAS
jgi:hypothetical protein